MFKKTLILTILSVSSFGIGLYMGKKFNKPKINTCGNLRLDKSEADEPLKIFFEVTNEKELLSSDYVVLKIIKEDYISHKK